MSTADIVSKLWSYCNVLRDAGPWLAANASENVTRCTIFKGCSMTRQHPLHGRIPAKRGPCSALRVATIRYGDYPGSSPGQANNEQLTYLLFGYGITSRLARYEPTPQQADSSACCLMMADERAYLSDKALISAESISKVLLGRSRPPYNQPSPVLAGYGWPNLMKNAQVTKYGAGCL